MKNKKNDNNDFLSLKFGSPKDWCFENSPKSLSAFEEYCNIETDSALIKRKNTPRQKELICIMIDNVKGPVLNDNYDTRYKNKEDAKRYVLNYD